jgi:hypothetical protein
MGELAVSRAFGDAEFKKGIQVYLFVDVWMFVVIFRFSREYIMF